MVENKSVIQEIIAALGKKVENKKVADIRIGLCYTAVLLDDGQLGLAYTFRSQNVPPCTKPFESGKIKGEDAAKAVQHALSENLIESSVGIATINAIVNQQIVNAIEGDILDVISLRNSDTAGMVGFFGPLIEPLKKTVKKIYIFEEKDIANFPDVYPSEKTSEILPECDVIIISATTLINKTIDSLLDLSKDARETIILGATTPFLPHVFIKRGVTMLSGIEVTDKNRMLQIVSEGGGMRDFKGSIKKMSVLLKKN
jgi:uncharacterized protein (DUF4213/DUF364 family)